MKAKDKALSKMKGQKMEGKGKPDHRTGKAFMKPIPKNVKTDKDVLNSI